MFVIKNYVPDIALCHRQNNKRQEGKHKVAENNERDLECSTGIKLFRLQRRKTDIKADTRDIWYCSFYVPFLY